MMSRHAHSINTFIHLAEKKSGIDGWLGYVWTAADGGSIVEGCVPDGVYSRGPRKGSPRFSRPIANTKKTILVSNEEADAAADMYIKETGNCYACEGTGQVFFSWTEKDGTKHKECEDCNGSGKAANG